MITLFLFLIGICFGSFINVLVDRLPAGESVLFGRSHCDFCHHPLAFYDLFPIISFIILRGRCGYCHKKLSLQYPLMEFFSGAIFVILSYFVMPFTLNFFLDVSIVMICFALFVMDLKYLILSDKLLIVLAVLSAIRLYVQNSSLLFSRLEIGLLSGIPLLLIFIFTKGKGMGFGDVKLIAVLGFLLGFPQIAVAYYLAFLTGAVGGVILILLRKKKFHGATIAFGPFLFLGALVANLWGLSIWLYIRSLMGF